MRALITGVTGRDGSYLAEFLLEKGYELHGIKRRTSQRHPVQPRVARPRGDVRYTQNHPSAGADQARAPAVPVSREPEREARLGTCARHRGAMADAAAARVGGLRHRDRLAVQ